MIKIRTDAQTFQLLDRRSHFRDMSRHASSRTIVIDPISKKSKYFRSTMVCAAVEVKRYTHDPKLNLRLRGFGLAFTL